MKQRLAILITFLAGSASLAMAQRSTVLDIDKTTAQMAGRTPTESDMYCSGFYSRAAVDQGLKILGSRDNGLKFEFADRDLVYLNRGSDFINAPGGTYILLREIKKPTFGTSFTGQGKILSSMGTLYSEIARIQIKDVHKNSATAVVLSACDSIMAGDFAVPVGERTPPAFKSKESLDQFAPPSGKATGTLAAVKEFQEAAGTNDIVYLNLGKRDGVDKGSNLRIFRKFSSPSQELVESLTKNYDKKMQGVTVGHGLTKSEISTLPRQVVGEIVVISATDDSATGIVSYSWQDLYPGDQVELE